MAIKSHIYLSKHITRIPQIQRDYVQGADRWKGKRDTFIDSLLDALENNRRCLLDFVYGTTDQHGFVPLDGQQRLTTLNLLGWMLLQRSDYELPDGVKLQIHYDTRDSSREFCNKLFSDKLNSKSKVSEVIKERIWYAEQWNYDPTIKAMLEMLDAIDKKLRERNADIKSLAEHFFTDSPIEFEIKDLELTDSADDLYVKINARGKGLTDFEHWKASFISFLKKNHPALCAFFEDKIEHEWCNLFWQYALKHYDESNDTYPRIDEYFMRFFFFVTNFLWANKEKFSGVGRENSYIYDINQLEDTEQERVWKEVYLSEDNVQTLFALLDAACGITNEGKSTDSFFESLLTSYLDPNPETPETSVRINIFGECDINILDHLVEHKYALALRPQALLFGILKYRSQYPSASMSELRSFVRVWWSYLQTLYRQRIAKKLSVEPDFRSENIYDALRMLNELLRQQDVYAALPKSDKEWIRMAALHNSNTEKYERDVVPLQNHPWLLCDLGNLENVILCKEAGETKALFDRFVGLDNNARIKSLIESGWNGTPTSTRNDRFITYGIENGWEYILTGKLPELELCLNGTKSAERKWVSDFIHTYIDLMSNTAYQPFGSFYCGDNRSLYAIARGSGITLLGYKLDPIAYVVARKADAVFSDEIHYKRHVAKLNYHPIDLYNENSTRWCITIPDLHLQLNCVDEGWTVSVYGENDTWPQQIPAEFRDGGSISQFNIDTTGIVKDIPGKDIIETGAELLKYIVARI